MKIKFLAVILFLTQFITLGAAPAAVPAAPAAAYISGVVGHAQSYALSCESRSAADLMQFWGVNVSETDFFNALPSSDNPNKGFVGSVHGTWGQIPPYPYGVHARPIAANLRNFGLEAQAHNGLAFGDIKDEIAAGRPVIVWVIGGVWAGTRQTYSAQDGSTMKVAAYEHSYLVIGYDETYVYMINAGNGVTETHTIDNFKTSWYVLGNMAVFTNGGDSGGSTSSSGDDGSSDNGSSSSGSDVSASGKVYTVKSGDYLKKIAEKFDTTWQALASLNGITYPYVIHVGQKLQIPGSGTASNDPAPTATPKPTDAPKATDAPQPTEAPQSTAEPTQVVDNSGQTYKVKPGDWLKKIAEKFDVTWPDLAALNGIQAPYYIYAGQVLKIPSGGSSGGTAPQATDAPQPTKAPSTDNPKTYTVQKGDYLVALSREFGISWQALASANNVTYPYIIYPGQQLQVP